MRTYLMTAAWSSTLLLTACGASPDPVEVVDPAPIFDAFDQLNTEIDILPLPTNMPVSGAAQYEGFARIDYGAGGDTEAIVGAANIGVDFSSQEVAGALTGFVHESGRKIGGTLQLDGGVIARERVSDLEVDGSLMIDGAPVVFSGIGRGQFLGDEAEALRLDLHSHDAVVGGPPGWTGAAYTKLK
ncbi:MAG: hypothetical protein ACU0DK_09760 [Pseudooceanicola sp.]